MTQLSAIIIDDEPLAISELALMLKVHPICNIIATAQNSGVAVDLVNEKKPDLIFLDINMPGKDGFELLEELEHIPQVIFVTAYDEFAIKAFEFNALDYLLKPINPHRLAEALQRSQKAIAQAKAGNGEQQLSLDKRIFVKDGDKCFLVQLSDIYLIESNGNYSQIFFKDQKPLMHRSLTYLEERLPSSSFFRANRKQIINLNFIKDIQPYFSNTLLVTLHGGSKIEISQRQTIKFREFSGI
ncbi:LytTR family two component transcriptional regulator [Flammeovirgaceae bacterium 311]|nr:LytTR family two component transcriptional regulator [Flammeovirgaceae bacterium 311]